jgi:hypothetical protein
MFFCLRKTHVAPWLNLFLVKAKIAKIINVIVTIIIIVKRILRMMINSKKKSHNLAFLCTI